MLTQRGIPIRWFAASRVDTLDNEMLAAMKGAGCVSIMLGVESASPTALQSMNKGITAEQIATAINTAREMGIEPHTNWIIGVPEETRESAQETVEFIKRHNIYCDTMRFVTPYPRCPYYEELVQRGAIYDLEAFLLSLERSPSTFLSYNLTTMPDSELCRLREEMEWDIRSHYCRLNPLVVSALGMDRDGQLKARAICSLQACRARFEVTWRKGLSPFMARCPDCHKNYFVPTSDLEQGIGC
jgi:hypothetical protein